MEGLQVGTVNIYIGICREVESTTIVELTYSTWLLESAHAYTCVLQKIKLHYSLKFPFKSR